MIITPPEKKAWPTSVMYGFTILFSIILVSGAGYGLIEQQKQFLLNDRHNEIATIADLKTSQIVQWRKERFAEGASIRSNAMMARRINDYITGNDRVAVRRELQLWMINLIDLGEYSRGGLFTPNGTVIASDSGLNMPRSEHYLEMIGEAAKEHELILSDFHRDRIDDSYSINLAIPIMHPDDTNSRCVAVLVLDIDPAKHLFPLIQSWPTTSATSETLLVRREGDSVLFLNDLRHRKKTATPFLVPLTDKSMPAVRAALGEDRSFEGFDYRGTAVLSTTRTVPGSRWGLVAKIDTSEVLAPLSKSIWWVTIAGAGVIISMITGVFLWDIRRKAETLRKLFEIEHKHNLELKKSEDALTRSRDHYLKLLDVFPALVWRSGTDSRCDYFNQTWLLFTGRTLEQELGEGWVDGVHPDDLERCIATYMEAFQNRLSFKMEYRLRFNDGSYRWINDHGSPYYDLDGFFAGFVGSSYDINAQKHAETELQSIHVRLEQQIFERTQDLYEINSLLRQEMNEREQLEQQLLSAKRLEAIGQIAGGVAHEVRNPLNAILTITEALFREREIAANPEYLPFIMHIRTQVNRLVLLMNDLLDLGRTIPAANLRPMPLFELCRETLDLWKTTGMSKNKRCILTSDNNDITTQILADAIKLQQVLFNLLENAGDHSDDDSKIMMLLVHNSDDQADGMAVLQIIDMGTGIADDKLPHVFDPFYTDRKGGTGLGLALVKHFVENMGGSVRIWNNTPPPGCTVEVRIPLFHLELK